LAEHKIAKNLTQCDLNGSIVQKDGTEIDRAVHVRDMFVKHVLWSYKESEFKVQGFDCEGDEGQSKSKSQEVLSCRWWFGEKEVMPKSPGWSVSLVFPYNPRTHEIKAAKIQCIKVP
jgi:hypothetical protein